MPNDVIFPMMELLTSFLREKVIKRPNLAILGEVRVSRGNGCNGSSFNFVSACFDLAFEGCEVKFDKMG